MKIKTSDIRKSFVEFFRKHDHRVFPSSPVIPHDDPTLLFVNAGMNQFKDVFTGQRKPEYPRAVTVQKCMRAGGKHNDLENVGKTSRHNTFFEMLGNFSFGDYFKEEAIALAWEWITKFLKLPPDRLYATVYEEDEEAFSLWGKIAPELKSGRILRFGKHDNLWSMGDTGPFGPCSEIHFDRGEKYGTGPEAVVNGEGDRFVEIWNLVFMQFDRKPDGSEVPLPRSAVDTGAGLERLACVMQNAETNFEIDIFRDLISDIEGITGRRYESGSGGVSHRVIADHVRALTFCIADGGGISNEKQGYVLRRILRRAARHGRRLGMHDPFIWRLVSSVDRLMGETYPEIREKEKHIEAVIRAEEESFNRTLDTGLELFDELVWKIKNSEGTFIPGGEVFRLYDTYGFPVDMTKLMAEEVGLEIDMEGFDRMMARQQEKSRAAATTGDSETEKVKFVITEALGKVLPADAVTEFVRDKFELETEIIEMFELGLPGDPMLAVIPEKTPFYVEAGGQLGDHGVIEHERFRIRVEHLIRFKDVIVHVGRFERKDYDDIEELTSQEILLRLNGRRRLDIMRNHTATHLLHASLRKILGEHVRQSGSYVGPDKLRFDFSHFRPMTGEEISRVETMVNEKILEGYDVRTVEADLDEARKSGAMAIFGEKYESRVRVVSIDDFSKELCGGTHVTNVARIGPFMITLETGIAAGVRRIEAVTGREAARLMLRNKTALDEIREIENQPPDDVASVVREEHEELLRLHKENRKLKAERFSSDTRSVGKEIQLDGLKYVPHNFGEVEQEEMAGWVDRVKSLSEPVVVTATGIIAGKATFMAGANAAAGVHVGKLTREVLAELGGRGGGKDKFAQGTYPSDLNPERIFKAVKARLEKIK